MQEEKIILLFDKYVTNSISPEELEEFLDLIQDMGEDQFFSRIERWLAPSSTRKLSAFANSEEVLSKIKTSISTHNEKPSENFLSRRFIKSIVAVAASLLVVFGFFVFKQKQGVSTAERIQSRNEIFLPDKTMPIIKLQNGQEVAVVENEQAALLKLGIELQSSGNGELTYHIKTGNHLKQEYNTFICPKGSSLKLVLADGTLAYLNSGAELRYPVHFNDKKREVYMEGEIYLEVNHDQDRPFLVHTKNTTIKVLGTKFNIDSKTSSKYTETTLVEGKVEVETNYHKKMLSPGFKAITNSSKGNIELRKADLKEVMAWREGYFRFTDDDVETVLTKIKDWYEIDDFMINSTKQDTFTGMIRRTNKLSELLQQLEYITSYKFKIEDGRVLVM